MSIEPYAPCPCGSGKKFKFCCHAVESEMARALSFVERNQARMALSVVEAVEKKHPGNPWATVARAEILIEEGLDDEAAELLESFLADIPGHKAAMVLLALAELAADGFELAKPSIHRAFQRCRGDQPHLLGSLAIDVAADMFSSGHYMACRQHLALALPLVDANDRKTVFSRLIEFDGSTQVPYPLRSVHELARYSGAEELQKDADKAARIAHIGCFAPAGRIFTRLAGEEPGNPVLWQNAGLCQAWDADESQAAESLHRAAELYADRQTAVESETLAQLLELASTDLRGEITIERYGIRSAARVMARLDSSDRLIRIVADEDNADAGNGLYYVLDRAAPGSPADLTIHNVPQIVAELAVYDAENEDDVPTRMFVSGAAGEQLDNVSDLLEELVGTEIADSDDEDDEQEDHSEQSVASFPQELEAFYWRWEFPDNVPVGLRRDLHRERWKHVVEHVWPDTPQAGLKGKTPREAAGDESLKIPLAAAVFVLDSLAEQRAGALDIDRIREEYQVEPPASIELGAEQPVHALSAMELQRVSLASLSNDQLEQLLHRAALIHHREFLYRMLVEAMGRSDLRPKFSHSDVCRQLAELCIATARRDEAFRWIERGRSVAGDLDDAFRGVMSWDVRELIVRLEYPADPRIAPLLDHIHRQYVRKVPELKETLDNALAGTGITPPWESGPITEGTEFGPTGSVWTPDSAAEENRPTQKKLWIPGQS